jgi:hypothetical protein
VNTVAPEITPLLAASETAIITRLGWARAPDAAIRVTSIIVRNQRRVRRS